MLIADAHHYRPTYLKTIHNQLSAIFNFGIKYYGLKHNPAMECGSMGKKHADTLNFWTSDEFDKFIKTFEAGSPADVIFKLLFYSGMRIGELSALTLADFDFAQRTVSILKTMLVKIKKI